MPSVTRTGLNSAPFYAALFTDALNMPPQFRFSAAAERLSLFGTGFERKYHDKNIHNQAL